MKYVLHQVYPYGITTFEVRGAYYSPAWFRGMLQQHLGLDHDDHVRLWLSIFISIYHDDGGLVIKNFVFLLEDALEDMVKFPSNAELLKLAEKNPPPQSWYDEDMEGLF